MTRLHPNTFLLGEALGSIFLATGEPVKAVAIHRRFLENFPQCRRRQKLYSDLLAMTGSREQQAAPPVWSESKGGRCNGACNWCG
jgi:hypothetical protein